LPRTLPCAKNVVPGPDHLRPFSAPRFMLDGRSEVSCEAVSDRVAIGIPKPKMGLQ
jgi:hypothetical protein